MRHFILAVLLFAGVPFGSLLAQDSLTSEVAVYAQRFQTRDSLAHRISVEAYRYWTKRYGGFVSAWYEPEDKKRAQPQALTGMMGMFYDPTETFEIALLGGFETYEEERGNYVSPRVGGFAIIGSPNFLLDIYGELGGSSGFWQQSSLTWQVITSLAVGIFAQTDDGVGGRVRLTVPRTSFRIWAAPMATPKNWRIDWDDPVASLKDWRLDREDKRWLIGADLIYQRRRPASR